ncbi:MAG: hypothetical protein KF773_01775 [Deltaproteobacteria bacterium]|nr:hypothetical protein [Deltaproteobacteria bacterium]
MPAARKSSFFRELRQVLGTPALLSWTALITFVPFYVFDSGLPQPGDFLILLVAPLAIYGWNRRLPSEHWRILRPLFLFTLWVALVNYSYALILNKWGLHGKETFILFPVYYLYNATTFTVVLVLYHRYRETFLRFTVNAVFIAVTVQVLYSFAFPAHNSLREAVFFNNPNQLGYYALCAGCVIALCGRRVKLGMLRAGLGMSACVYLALLSASRAAAGGVVIIFIVTFVTNPRVILATIPIVVLALAIGGPITRAIDATQRRVAVDQFPQYTFFEERGYGRIQHNMEYIILGAGEGGTDRFRESIIGTHEIHSSAGTILFSYGIVGSMIMLTFLWRVIKGAHLRLLLTLAPILAFTVAHNGLRESMLWVLFALFAIVKREPTATSPPKRDAPQHNAPQPRPVPAT